MITTVDGEVPIEDLSVGDKILSFDETNGKSRYALVTETYRLVQVGFLVINGTLKVTSSHPFHVGGRWVDAQDLKVGDVLTRHDGSLIKVETIEKVDRGVRVYNIEVDGSHTFFAGGYLVHNKGPDLDG